MKEKLPYGTWPSPLSAQKVAAGARRFGQVQLDQGFVYWVESRPEEGGRSVLVRCGIDGKLEDCVPEDFTVRTRVHEYGGVAYVVKNGLIHCSRGEDGRVYRFRCNESPEPLTPDNGSRYADFCVSEDGETVFCVREVPQKNGEPKNDVVCLSDGQLLICAEGNDFYAYPRISNTGDKLSWITWCHPNMPWDGTELWVSNWDGNQVERAQCIAGGAEISIFQPTWGEDGELFYVSDETGWWNLHCWDGHQAMHICKKDAEFGLPLWVLGMSTYALLDSNQLLCSYIEKSTGFLARFARNDSEVNEINLPFSEYSSIASDGHTAAFVAGSWDQSSAVIRLNLEDGSYDIIRQNESHIAQESISKPQTIMYPSLDGEMVHAFYYPPHHDQVEGIDENPPLWVKSHGGPTGSTSSTLDLSIQYWTSRGFAVLDVDYRGSTGYGRAYRNALDGQWGVRDVEDCVAGAQFLGREGLVDVARVVIRGGSAGGLTTLGALAFYDTFRAGASYYGVSDLSSLAKITHKFESQYLNRLIGGDEIERVYRERSPLYAADKISVPVIFFQGTEDPVVPPVQTETMANALRANGVPVACVMFEGEMHGFRKAENIIAALQSEYAFYATIFGLDCSEKLTEISIDNWPSV